MKNIVVIAGNGGLAYNKTNILELSENLKNNVNINKLTILGNGEQNITYNDIIEQLEQLPNEPTIFIFICHGTMRFGKFYFAGNEQDISAEKIYHFIGKKFNDCEIFNTACNSGGSLDFINCLKEGTKVVTLSKARESTYGAQIVELIKSLANYRGNIECDNLLYLYLLKCVENRGSIPQISISGANGIIDLDACFERKLGKLLKKDNFEDLESYGIPIEKIENIASKFPIAKNEYAIYAKEYGIALALALYDEFGLTINLNNIKSISKNNISKEAIYSSLSHLNAGECFDVFKDIGYRRYR